MARPVGSISKVLMVTLFVREADLVESRNHSYVSLPLIVRKLRELSNKDYGNLYLYQKFYSGLNRNYYNVRTISTVKFLNVDEPNREAIPLEITIQVVPEGAKEGKDYVSGEKQPERIKEAEEEEQEDEVESEPEDE